MPVGDGRHASIAHARELHEKIFEPYFTTKPAECGTGPGLSIVRETIETVGGEIRLDSDLGEGSVFEIWLPLHLPSMDATDVVGRRSTREFIVDVPACALFVSGGSAAATTRQRQASIAQAAYRYAERRRFVRGNPTDLRLEAERETDALLTRERS